ncbi:PREDICTED: uncharacterized protein LOC109185199 [Ipomoea nil]|uniref:uncharacterized protein LOC109185199 n=1 Tax=Ipomoea nil TaxID=35883 RepID=UPI000900E50A|nr:PREDICTED: uncharacterized protein LOC109185199 [Ipomoea nil]
MNKVALWEGLCLPKAKGGMGFRRLHEMNKDLLGKQGWRLITMPSTLVTRVFKAHCYPICGFFDSSVGNNPSYIWRSLWEVQDCLKEGCRRAVGNGDDTFIGTDPWLPVDNNPYVETVLHPTVHDAPMSSLMNRHGTGCDVECVKDIFTDRDANLILNIPLSTRRPPDRWIWHWDDKSAYTVKSCYKHLTTVAGDDHPWAKIWSLHIPPKFFWAISSLNDSALPNFVMVCWGLWGSRNERVWNGLGFDSNTVVHRALPFLENWKLANEASTQFSVVAGHPTRWSKPALGRIKLNCDAAICQGSIVMGISWVLRDDEGKFLAAKNTVVPRNYLVKEAEALSIREALSWLISTSMGSVDVEMESQVVFNALFSSSFSSAFGLLIDDVRGLASAIGDVEFHFVKRSVNCTAHVIAREAFLVSGCGEGLDSALLFLVNILELDLMD